MAGIVLNLHICNDTHMKITKYQDRESSVEGTFFELPEEAYVQVEHDEEGVVVLWASTRSLGFCVAQFRRVLGAPVADEAPEESGQIITNDGVVIEPSSAQAEFVAQIDPQSVSMYLANHNMGSVSWRKECTRLEDGRRPLTQCTYSDNSIHPTTLFELIETTSVQAVYEACHANQNEIIAALGEKAVGHI